MKTIVLTDAEKTFIAKYQKLVKMFAVWERTEEEQAIEDKLSEDARSYMEENDLWDDIEKPTFNDMILWYWGKYNEQGN